MTGDDLAVMRARATAAGLDLDGERLRILAESMEDVRELIGTIERIEINPVDLALETYEPAWWDGERGR